PGWRGGSRATLGRGTARQHDPVQGLVAEPEEHLAGGEVAGEGAVGLLADRGFRRLAPRPQASTPLLERAHIVIGVSDEGLEPEVRLPPERQLRQRWRHRLREDAPPDPVGDRALVIETD